MQKVTQQFEYDNLFPVLEINDSCIISKGGDISFAYELSLPPKNVLEPSRCNELRKLISRALATLPVGTTIHKQDIYFKKKYRAPREESSFLLKSYWDHFEGREYLSHRSILYFCLPHKGRRNISCSQSTLSRRSLFYASIDPQELIDFKDRVEQAIAIITSDKHLIQATKLSEKGCQSLINILTNFSYQQELVISDIQARPNATIIGERNIYNLSLTSLRDMPDNFEENVLEYSLSTDTTSVFSSVLSQIGFHIPANHVVNQYIKIIDSDKEHSRMASNARFMQSFSSLSADNAINCENISGYLLECSSRQQHTVKCSVQILLEGDNSISSTVALLLRQGFRTRLNTFNAPLAFWANIPGNSPDLGNEEYMTMSLDTAIDIMCIDSSSRSIPDGNFYICDRITHTPISLDFAEIAYNEGLISNYNIFTLGPSGTGKSFLTNEIIMQAYNRDKAHCVIVDQGNSYSTACQIIREETNGEDSIFFNGEEYPFSFNPFINADKDSVEDNAFLTSLIFCLLQKGNPTATERSIVSDAVMDHLTSDYPRSLDGFYDYFNKVFIKDKENLEDINGCQFSIPDFRRPLKQFIRKGLYSKLLNCEENADLTDKRFILFEIDNISKNEVLFPIVTLLITKIFADKMKAVPGRKIMLIEEAWKAILSPHMESWIHWLWKTARKHNAQAIVVTQEVQDLLASPIIKESIIANSSIKMLLNQDSIKNRYDVVASHLSLSEQDQNIIFSIERDKDPRYKYGEVFISIGSHKYVYALEPSMEAYWTYTTYPPDKALREEEIRKTGSYIQTVKNLANRQK